MLFFLTFGKKMSIFPSNDKLILKEIELDNYQLNPVSVSGMYVSEDPDNYLLVFSLIYHNQEDIWQMKFNIKKNYYFVEYEKIKNITKIFSNLKNTHRVESHMIENLVKTLKRRVTSEIFESYSTINFKKKIKSEGLVV